MIVNVMGIGRAFRIDFEDVFVSAEVMYQIRQRPWMISRELARIFLGAGVE
jgi:hypothetical protein